MSGIIDRIMGRQCSCESGLGADAPTGPVGDAPIWEVPDLSEMLAGVQLDALRRTVVQPVLARLRMSDGNRQGFRR